LQLGFSPEVRADSARSGWELGVISALAKPIKDGTAPDLLKAFQSMEQELVARGLKPKLMKLDNEASKLLKDYLYQQDITFQLVPPYSHRRNSAQRAIRSFKDHLIAGVCSTDKSFPMYLWDRILPQAVITLNMLRTSRINPKLSAATHLFGQYDFNRAPMAPREQDLLLMKHQEEEELGLHMDKMAGISDQY
jgi:hypothetical protein